MKLRANPVRMTLLPVLGLAAAAVFVGRSQFDLNAALSWFLGINLGTYPVWWIDKRQAKGGGFRVPEWTLHLLSVAGGGPAAVLAMRTLRHKTLKPVFRILHPILAAAAMVGIAWWTMIR